MIYYTYSQFNNTLTGSGIADESPLEPGVFLLPAYSTTEVPPSVSEREIAVYDKLTKKWLKKPDYRGTIYYDSTGSLVSITDIDQLPDPSWTTEPPVVETPEEQPAELVVTPWQIRQALNQLGLRTQIEQLVHSTSNQDIKDGWEFATEWREFHPIVQLLGQQLGLTPNQIHAVFVLAKEK